MRPAGRGIRAAAGSQPNIWTNNVTAAAPVSASKAARRSLRRMGMRLSLAGGKSRPRTSRADRSTAGTLRAGPPGPPERI